MGLAHEMVEAIFREHSYSPITGDVLLIGRQTVYVTPEELLALAQRHGGGGGVRVEDIEIDTSTIGRRDTHADATLVHDRAIFKMLGNERVKALDHTHYEGAEVVHNLNTPVPDDLKACADFIVDGSTLDNVFSPALTIRNYVDLLRPGGRLLMINLWSNYYDPYVLVSPLWYLDYFAVNKFADCKVYLGVYHPTGGTNVFCLNLDCLLDKERTIRTFVPPEPCEVSTIVFAEKGQNSTSDVTPTQQHYRSDKDWIEYRRTIRRFRISPRPHLVSSRAGMMFEDVIGGHMFVGGDYTEYGPARLGRLRKKERELDRLLHEAEELRQKALREAEELRQQASREAEELKQEASRQGEELKQEASREGEELKQEASREAEEIRQEALREAEVLRQQALREAEELRQKALREAEELRQEASREAEELRQEASRGTEELRQEASREAEELRQKASREAELIRFSSLHPVKRMVLSVRRRAGYRLEKSK